MASKIEDAYKTWIAQPNIPTHVKTDSESLYELAYQIYLAKQNGDKEWHHMSGGQWLADKLSADGRFNNQHIGRYSYMIEDLVNYNFWLVKRNSEV